MYLPDEIRKIIENKPYTVDDIGQSGSKVLIFDDMVLKIQLVSAEVDNEVQLMQWLKDKISAPECLCHIKENDTDYLLMTKIKGKMACDEEYMSNPNKLIDILARAMKNLWSVDISECPADMTLDTKLKMAEFNVKNNLVDTENTQPGTLTLCCCSATKPDNTGQPAAAPRDLKNAQGSRMPPSPRHFRKCSRDSFPAAL